ncbi:MAG: hypothetical protein R3F19_21845 [Verrucomicrobiales bacterium]
MSPLHHSINWKITLTAMIAGGALAWIDYTIAPNAESIQKTRLSDNTHEAIGTKVLDSDSTSHSSPLAERRHLLETIASMDATALRERIDSLAGARDSGSWKVIMSCYSRWLELDPESAAAHVLSSPSSTGRSPQIFLEWSRTDRDAAFAFAATVSDNQLRANIQLTIGSDFAADDPAGYVNWLQMRDAEGRMALAKATSFAFRELAMLDPQGTADRLLGIGDDTVVQAGLRVVDAWLEGGGDLMAVRDWAESLTVSQGKWLALAPVINALAKSDPDAVGRMIAEMKVPYFELHDEMTAVGLRSDQYPVPALLKQLTAESPATAVKWSQRYLTGVALSGALRQIDSILADGDSDEALLNFCESAPLVPHDSLYNRKWNDFPGAADRLLQSDSFTEANREGFFSHWARADAESALRYLIAQPASVGNDGLINQHLPTVFESLAWSKPSEALQYLDQLPEGELRNMATAATINGITWEKLDKSVELLDSITDPELHREASRRIGGAMMGTEEPSKVVEWANTLPPSSRDAVMANVGVHWLATGDPQGQQWLESLPEGSSQHDTALKSAADRLTSRDPVEALRRANEISDPAARIDLLDSIIDTIALENPIRALEVIAKAPLTPEARQRLTSLIE